MARKPKLVNVLEGMREGMRIAHWTPGRIRIAFEDPIAADRFARSILNVRGVISARANSLTGSVLIQYREEDEALTQVLGSALPSQSARSIVGPHRCPECRQALRSPEADALPKLVKLTGSILTGDVLGVMWWLLSTSYEGHAEFQAA